MNDSFVHFASFKKAIRRIKDPMVRLAAYEMLEDYALEGIIPDEEAPVEVLMLFDAFQPVIDSNISKRINGSKGGRPRKAKAETTVSENKNCGFENKKPTFSETETIVSDDKNHRLSKPESNVHVNVHVNGDVHEDVHANENENGDVNVDGESISAPDGADAPAPAKKPKPVKHKYGEYKNVLLTDDEVEKLRKIDKGYTVMLERLSEYIASTGKSYKSHYATLRAWMRREAENAQQRIQKSDNPFLDMLKNGDFSEESGGDSS